MEERSFILGISSGLLGVGFFQLIWLIMDIGERMLLYGIIIYFILAILFLIFRNYGQEKSA